MIFETHSHLDDQTFDADRSEVIKRLRAIGIVKLINVGFDLASSKRSLELAQSYPEIVAAVGIHPHDAEGLIDADWQELRELASNDQVVAIGEIGLDYYRDLSPRDIQQQVFERQLQLAIELDLPVIIHNREAHQDVIDRLKEYTPAKGGVFHCFSGSWEIAKVAMNLGFYISFAGPVTYKNAANLREVAARIPLDRLLVETDCPYLSPEPLRGKRNEPANVQFVVDKLAEIKGISPQELAEITAKNGAELFGIRL
ncbi:MAG TPA: TatD family hydrolase [Candidatus Deferrimicrobium sp.]|nr:TatD family hydrolase [Candidatus Deferrimicrobium sp.]